jgi:hypothetical protein
MARFIEGEDRCQRALHREYLDDYVSNENPVRVIERRREVLAGRSFTEAPGAGVSPWRFSSAPRAGPFPSDAWYELTDGIIHQEQIAGKNQTHRA